MTDVQVLVPVRSRIGVAGSCNCQERCRLDGTAAELWPFGGALLGILGMLIGLAGVAIVLRH